MEENEGKTQGWTGHTFRKSASNITRQTLTWDPQGEEKEGKTQADKAERRLRQRSGHCWKELEKTTQSRVGWRIVVVGLRSSWGKSPSKASPSVVL